MQNRPLPGDGRHRVQLAMDLGTATQFDMNTLGISASQTWQMFSPRVDDVKYSGSDGCRVLGVEVWVSLEKLKPWVIEKQFSDERL